MLTCVNERLASFGSLESGKALSRKVYCLAMPTDAFARASSTVMLSRTCELNAFSRKVTSVNL